MVLPTIALASAGARAEDSRNLAAKTESSYDRFGHAVATLACKGKCIHQDGTNLFTQLFTQEPPGAVEPCFDGLRRQIEEVRCLVNVHPLDHARYEYDAINLGQIFDRACSTR